MTALSERPGVTTTSFTSRARIAAILLVGLGALAACSIDGVDRGLTPPSGPTGVGVGGGGSGSGGGGGGGGGNFTGTYTLQSANDSTLPVRFIYDSVAGGDTIVVFGVSFDSSLISLNSGNTVNESDFLSLYELRSSTIPGDSNFNRTDTVTALTSGTYAISGTTLTITRVDTANGNSTEITSFTIGAGTPTTLTGGVPFSVDNSYGETVTGTVALIYNLTGPPQASVLRKRTLSAAGHQSMMNRLRVRLGTPLAGFTRSALRARWP
jgi:hypothetical protein